MSSPRIAGAALALAVLTIPTATADIIRSGKTHSGKMTVSNTFKRLDRDGNRLITQAEWPRSAELFRRLDRNNDGRLTKREFQRVSAEARKLNRERTDSPDANTDAEARKLNRSRTDSLGGMDANHDGWISAVEWSGTARAFRQIDWNRDGVLSRRELLVADRRGNAYDDNRNDQDRDDEDDDDDDDDDEDEDKDDDDPDGS